MLSQERETYITAKLAARIRHSTCPPKGDHEIRLAKRELAKKKYPRANTTGPVLQRKCHIKLVTKAILIIMKFDVSIKSFLNPLSYLNSLTSYLPPKSQYFPRLL